MLRISLAMVVVLGACAPIPVAQAEQECADRISTQGVPQTSVTVGAGSGGGWLGVGAGLGAGLGVGIGVGSFDDGWNDSGVGVGVSATVPAGPPPDPEAAYARCVQQRSGAAPATTLASRL